MTDVGELVVRAAAPGGEPVSRYRAFEELVLRFQDMAFACAYGRLGDRGLAEDAAQEAFVSAWLNLDQLRSAEAFPGWFRQIVLRQCNRVARRRGPATLDVEELNGRAAGTGDPAVNIERLDQRQTLWWWMGSLPEHERSAVLLSYFGGRSQKEIAALLGVTANTVKQRLFSARGRLRQRLTAEMARELNEQRPSRDGAFVGGVRVRLRAFAGDYEGLEVLVARSEANGSVRHLDAEDDQAKWLANRSRFEAEGLIPHAYTVERRGENVAYGCIERVDLPRLGDYPPSGRPGATTFRVHLVVLPGEEGAIGPLYERLEADAMALQAKRMWCRVTSEHMDVVDRLRTKGFEELHRVYEWHVGVEGWAAEDVGIRAYGHARIEAVGDSPAVASDDAEVRVTTLREEMSAGNDYIGALHTFWNAPGGKTSPDERFSREEVEERLKRRHVEAASYFIAWLGAAVAGVLAIRRPHEAAAASADLYFKVLRGVAGKGIEERLLSAAVQYGQAHSLHTLTAYFMDPFNDAAYFEGLGLRRSMELIVLEKALNA
jgi:RNA polymerase sigma factor (sigma-70 family)